MLLSDIYSTKALALYITEVASNKIPFLGKAYFPDNKNMGIDLSWLRIHKGLNVALKPSTFDALPTIRTRGKASMTKEQMPFFRESMIIKEHDLIELSRIAKSNDPYLQPVISSIYNDSYVLYDGAEISAEMMRMGLLAPLNGNMKINIPMADNTIATYDYDEDGTWKANNFMELTSSDTWDNTSTAKPLNDIRKGVKYLASKGIIATTIISNSNTFDYLLENDQIKNALISITGTTITYVDEPTVEDIIRRKTRLNWIIYDKMYEDYNGTQQKFYPDNYVTILGDGILGNTWRGTTPEEITTIGNFIDAPTPPVDITILENGVAIAIQTEYKPSFTITTTVSQIALPSYEGMDSVYVIKVK